ncbi:MAG TPA: Plug domain-containing protein, partial [Candidatus Binatia bacterium]|nr:Plug domain-containing protein [Candidatus Binatia bacterium]
MTSNSRVQRAGAARLAQTSITALAMALACFATSAEAQDAGQTSAAGDRTYEAAEFARFAPQTALDMLNQVPGFTIRQATIERGLGQATGNVLLNGQRISNKSDDILAQLRRIPAESVIRIEIRDGAALGISGLSGQVANVVARNVGLRGQWAYRPEFRALFTEPLLTRFETSISGERGPFEYTIGLENQSNHSGAGGPTRILDASGSVIELRHDEWTGQNNQPRLTGRLGYRGPNGQVGNLNASGRVIDYVFEEDGFWTSTTLADRERRVRQTQDGWDYEIGGDYEFG